MHGWHINQGEGIAILCTRRLGNSFQKKVSARFLSCQLTVNIIKSERLDNNR